MLYVYLGSIKSSDIMISPPPPPPSIYRLNTIQGHATLDAQLTLLRNPYLRFVVPKYVLSQ